MKRIAELPVNVDAERIVLAAVLHNGASAYYEAARLLVPGDFSHDAHLRLFRLFGSMAKRGAPLELPAIAEELQRASELEVVGGLSYIAGLTEGVSPLVRTGHYARVVKEKAILRRLVHACNSTTQQALDASADIGLVERAEQGVSALAQEYRRSISEFRIGILISEVETEQVRWLWRNRIPLGKLTILDGDPDLGKSAIALDLAARVSRRRPMPDGDPGEAGGVVLLSAEDGLGDTIRPRLEAAGADLSRIAAISTIPDGAVERAPEIPRDVAHIEAEVRRLGARLAVIDPLTAFLAGEVNSRIDQDVRRALVPLARMAERTGAAVLVIRHLNKMAGGNPLYRGGGSIGIVAAARSGLLAARDPNEADMRVLASTKNNLGPAPPSLAYRLVGAENGAVRVGWIGPSQHSASALLSAAAGGEDRTALTEAVDFLRDCLASGPRPGKALREEARSAGIADATLRRAKVTLGIVSRKDAFGGAWLWRLPDSGPKMFKPAEDAQPKNVSTFAGFEHLRLSKGLSAEPEARDPEDAQIRIVNTLGKDDHLQAGRAETLPLFGEPSPAGEGQAVVKRAAESLEQESEAPEGREVAEL